MFLLEFAYMICVFYGFKYTKHKQDDCIRQKFRLFLLTLASFFGSAFPLFFSSFPALGVDLAVAVGFPPTTNHIRDY